MTILSEKGNLDVCNKSVEPVQQLIGKCIMVKEMDTAVCSSYSNFYKPKEIDWAQTLQGPCVHKYKSTVSLLFWLHLK